MREQVILLVNSNADVQPVVIVKVASPSLTVREIVIRPPMFVETYRKISRLLFALTDHRKHEWNALKGRKNTTKLKK